MFMYLFSYSILGGIWDNMGMPHGAEGWKLTQGQGGLAGGEPRMWMKGMHRPYVPPRFIYAEAPARLHPKIPRGGLVGPRVEAGGYHGGGKEKNNRTNHSP